MFPSGTLASLVGEMMLSIAVGVVAVVVGGEDDAGGVVYEGEQAPEASKASMEQMTAITRIFLQFVINSFISDFLSFDFVNVFLSYLY